MKIEGSREYLENDKMESKNFLLISLEEQKAKKVAEAISNPTCRRIIDALASKDHTESDLAESLKIPISTVHYNLKQLMEANLVIVEEFHYSSKGKEVNHYRLANKYIIIAPKSESPSIAEALKKVFPLGAITVLGACILGALTLIKNPVFEPKAQASVMSTPAVSSGPTLASAAQAAELTRPLLQSQTAAWIIVGAISITVLYFIYELVRKK